MRGSVQTSIHCDAKTWPRLQQRRAGTHLETTPLQGEKCTPLAFPGATLPSFEPLRNIDGGWCWCCLMFPAHAHAHHAHHAHAEVMEHTLLLLPFHATGSCIASWLMTMFPSDSSIWNIAVPPIRPEE